MIPFTDKKVLITGGMGFIGSNLARRLVGYENRVTVVDSMSPQYGGNPRNLEGLMDKISVSLSDIRDEKSIKEIIKDQDYILI